MQWFCSKSDLVDSRLISPPCAALASFDRLQHTQHKILHSRMKPNSFLFLVLLGFSSLSLAMSSIDESNVKSYFVVRKVWNPDLFRVNMKYGSQCAKGMTLKAWCDALGAITGEVSANRRSCSCTCPSDVSYFLPSLRRCISKGQLPANFGGGYLNRRSFCTAPYFIMHTVLC